MLKHLTFHLWVNGAFIALMLIASKTSAQNFDWVRTINGTSLDACRDVVVSPNTGFIYTTGDFRTTADFLTGPDSLIATSWNECAYVCKYNTYGELIWVRTLSATAGKSNGRGIAVDADDNVIFVGGFSNTVDFDPSDTAEAIQIASNKDAFICKLDQNGNFLWVNRINSSYEIEASGVATDLDNNIILCGTCVGNVSMFGAFSLQDDVDGYVVKLDGNGDFQWVNPLEDVPGTHGPGTIATDANNNCYVTGYYAQNNAPLMGFLQKIDTNGDDGWRVELGHPSGSALITDVCCSAYGVFASGYFYEYGIIGNALGSNYATGNGENYDALAFKLSPETGNPIWASEFGSSGNEYGTAIATDNNGNVYLTGTFEGTVSYANIPMSTITAAGRDVFVWKIQADGTGTNAYSLTNPEQDDITPYAISTWIDGAIYTAGASYGITDFDQDLVDVEEHISSGNSDAFLHRTTDCDAFMAPPTQYFMFCEGDSIEFNGTYYSEPEITYSEPLVSQWGCDSTITYQFSYYPNESYYFHSLCPGDSLNITYGTVHEAGEYLTEYVTSEGCDSTLHEVVDLITTGHTYEYYDLCEGEILAIHDQQITSGGDYLLFVENDITGCQDTVSASVDLVVLNNDVIIQGNSLTAEETGATYQWFDCTTTENIDGADAQSFNPGYTGLFGVVVVNNGCEVTSDCIEFIIEGVDEDQHSGIVIYPNPVQGQCHIISKQQHVRSVELYDPTGRHVLRSGILRFAGNQCLLNTETLKPGIYQLVITLGDGSMHAKRIVISQ